MYLSIQDLQLLLKPISDKISEIQAFREKNRRSEFFNHLSAISESISALGKQEGFSPSFPFPSLSLPNCNVYLQLSTPYMTIIYEKMFLLLPKGLILIQNSKKAELGIMKPLSKKQMFYEDIYLWNSSCLNSSFKGSDLKVEIFSPTPPFRLGGSCACSGTLCQGNE